MLTGCQDYSVILYTGLGFKGSLSLILAAAYVSAAVIFNYVNSLIIDKYGRVRLLGMSICCILLDGDLTYSNKSLASADA